jgi:hypothetical protein
LLNCGGPRNFTPIHRLTGPDGQPFASHLGSQRFASRGCKNSQWNWVSPVSAVSLIGDPDVIRSLASPPFSGCFTRLHADNVKSQRLRHSSVGASLGFTPTMWRADLIAHHMPFLVPSHSLQVLLLPSQHSDCLEPRSSCWGEPLQFHSNTQSPGPVG